MKRSLIIAATVLTVLAVSSCSTPETRSGTVSNVEVQHQDRTAKLVTIQDDAGEYHAHLCYSDREGNGACNIIGPGDQVDYSVTGINTIGSMKIVQEAEDH